MAHSVYETRPQGSMIVVFIKITIQSKMINPCRRMPLRDLAVAMSRNSAVLAIINNDCLGKVHVDQSYHNDVGLGCWSRGV